MKKIYILVAFAFVIVGCSYNGTPKFKVEQYLLDYKNMDKKIISTINSVNPDVDRKGLITYKRQFKDMTYNIVDEKIKKNKATVVVDLEIYDYMNVREKANKYFASNKNEFTVDGVVDDSKLERYILKRQMETTDQIKFRVKFKLNKKDNKWVVEELNQTKINKILGIM